MKFKIALLSGDGIGPEVTEESLKILDGISKKYGHEFEFDYQDVGGIQLTSMVLQLLKKALVNAWRASSIIWISRWPKMG